MFISSSVECWVGKESMIVEIDELSTKTLADRGGEVLPAFTFMISIFELWERRLVLSEASGADCLDLLRG